METLLHLLLDIKPKRKPYNLMRIPTYVASSQVREYIANRYYYFLA